MTTKESKEKLRVPAEVSETIKKLEAAGFEAYAVGGCVRDLLLGKEPDDWDITTGARPKQIQKVFPKSFYSNKFFTVTIQTGSENPRLQEIEITTYRVESRYSDKRHPDKVRAAKTLAEDLSRRDFTVNAMALSKDGKVVDLFDGRADLEKKLIRAVGEPEQRFTEDVLRMVRAVRIGVKLGFTIEPKTIRAIKENAAWLQACSKERIRDELLKIVGNKSAKQTIEMLHEAKLLKYILPELEEGIGIEQRGAHKYDVWEHNLRAMEYAVEQNFPMHVRLAALLHDVAKPRKRERDSRRKIWTFHGHDVLGEIMTYEILERFHFSRKEIEMVARLVRWHLFPYKIKRDEQYRRDLLVMGEDPKVMDIEDSSEEDVQETTDSAIRRLIVKRVGPEHIFDLIKLRFCDRVGTGVPKVEPYRLRHYQFRVEKILREGEAVTLKTLKVNGDEVMGMLGIKPGPRVGHILYALLEEVLDDPKKNDREYLLKRTRELSALADEELVKLRERAEEKFEAAEMAREAEIKKKYRVK